MRWALGGLLAIFATATAWADPAPLRIGVLTDLSSIYSDNTGQGVVTAIRLAVQDYGGAVAGRRIEVLVSDHQNKLDIGKPQAARWYDTDDVAVVMDVSNTPLAIAIKDVTAERNRLFITAAPTMALTGEQCSPTTIQWTHDNWSVAYPISKALVEQGLDTWFYIAVDYAFGKELQGMSEEVVKAAGGKSLGAVRHPLGTADFSAYLLQAQSSGAKILALANSGTDTTNALKQAAEFGIGGAGAKQHVTALLTAVNAIPGVGLELAQGLYISEPFYWDLNDGTRAFSKRFYEALRKMPNFLQAGMYGATLHYLKAVDAVAKTNPGAATDGHMVAAKMRELPTDDPIYGRGYLRADNRHIHTTYLFQVKSPTQSTQPWDVYTLVRTFPGEEVVRPIDPVACRMGERR